MKRKVYEFDIHGEEKQIAIKKIQLLLNTIPENYTEILIIHGYKNGRVLQKAIRNELKHRKIKKRFLSLNDGVTTLVLSDEHETMLML